MVNKQGQTRLAQYFEFKPIPERVTMEGELIRRCLSRTENQCSFVEFRQYKVIYRRYASLYFIVGADQDDVVGTLFLTVMQAWYLAVCPNPNFLQFPLSQNELSVLEFIHALVETLDKYFENVVSY